jgi:hypothetical protein
VPASRDPDCNNIAIDVVLNQLPRDVLLGYLHVMTLFHLALPLLWCLITRLRLCLVETIVRNPCRLGIRALTGRKDGGRGDGPIRHGALPATAAASARAISLRGAVVRKEHDSWDAARSVAVRADRWSTAETVAGGARAYVAVTSDQSGVFPRPRGAQLRLVLRRTLTQGACEYDRRLLR